MDYFEIETDWDPKGNSPWDAVWLQDLHETLPCLSGSFPLAPIWKSPPMQYQKRKKRADVLGFILHYAVTARVRKVWSPLIDKEVEFLPLKVPDLGTVYVIHPLWPVDFDERAKFSAHHRPGSNITVVETYSFTLNPAAFPGPRHLFRMRQAQG